MPSKVVRITEHILTIFRPIVQNVQHFKPPLLLTYSVGITDSISQAYEKTTIRLTFSIANAEIRIREATFFRYFVTALGSKNKGFVGIKRVALVREVPFLTNNFFIQPNYPPLLTVLADNLVVKSNQVSRTNFRTCMPFI